MVTPNLNADGFTGNILIEPNRPISWRENLNFIRVFTLLSALVSALFLYKGLYLVLPFSGLEVISLSIALYLVYKRYSVCQIIYFTRDSVIIESGTDHASERIEYQRFWSRFYIDHKGHQNIPILQIRSRQHATEIGDFLSYADKLLLIQLIKDLTLHFQRSNTQLKQ